MKTLSETIRLDRFKAEAKALRQRLADQGQTITHSQALEQIAHSEGARDWNTLCARVARERNPRPLTIGDRVTGRYLGQPFAGYVHGVNSTPDSELCRVTLHFDEPVDVVTFNSFSSYRQRVSAIIDKYGRSPHRITGGEPQIVVTVAGE